MLEAPEAVPEEDELLGSYPDSSISSTLAPSSLRTSDGVNADVEEEAELREVEEGASRELREAFTSRNPVPLRC